MGFNLLQNLFEKFQNLFFFYFRSTKDRLKECGTVPSGFYLTPRVWWRSNVGLVQWWCQSCRLRLWNLRVHQIQCQVKVSFIQKGLVNLSFLQTDEPNYFPELKFFFSKWLKSCQIRTWSWSNALFEHSDQLQVPF